MGAHMLFKGTAGGSICRNVSGDLTRVAIEDVRMAVAEPTRVWPELAARDTEFARLEWSRTVKGVVGRTALG